MDCMIQSWPSAWIVRDLVSHSLHSVLALFVIGEGEEVFPLTFQTNITIHRLVFDEGWDFIFSPENSTIASGEVNTIFFITVGHSMANTGGNTLVKCSTKVNRNKNFRLQNHLLFCTATKIQLNSGEFQPQIRFFTLANVLTSICEGFWPSFDQINIPPVGR